MPPEAIIAGLATALTTVVGVAWREFLKWVADLRAQRDIAIAGWRDQVAATNRLADAIEARARSDAKRTRQTDASPPRRTDV